MLSYHIRIIMPRPGLSSVSVGTADGVAAIGFLPARRSGNIDANSSR